MVQPPKRTLTILTKWERTSTSCMWRGSRSASCMEVGEGSRGGVGPNARHHRKGKSCLTHPTRPLQHAQETSIGGIGPTNSSTMSGGTVSIRELVFCIDSRGRTYRYPGESIVVRLGLTIMDNGRTYQVVGMVHPHQSPAELSLRRPTRLGTKCIVLGIAWSFCLRYRAAAR